MVAVDTIDGVKYGFRLLGYLLAVAIAGGLLFMIGAGFAPRGFNRGNPILMLVFVVAGMAVIYAGGLGMLYKVIADAVEVGNHAAKHGGPASSPPPSPRQPPRDGQPPAARQGRRGQGHQQGTTAQQSHGQSGPSRAQHEGRDR